MWEDLSIMNVFIVMLAALGSLESSKAHHPQTMYKHTRLSRQALDIMILHHYTSFMIGMTSPQREGIAMHSPSVVEKCILHLKPESSRNKMTSSEGISTKTLLGSADIRRCKSFIPIPTKVFISIGFILRHFQGRSDPLMISSQQVLYQK